jgi:hypothetical protein
LTGVKGDGKYLLFLVLLAGLILEACGAPVLRWAFSAITSWFEEIPDLHTNISKLAGEAVWPAAVVTLALLFREEIARILRSIKRFTWGDKSVDLSEDLDAIEQRVSRYGLASEGNDIGLNDKFVRLIEHAPSAAILESWKELESLLREIALHLSLNGKSGYGSRRLIEHLFKNELIDGSERFVLVGLAEIRNKAVHTDEVSRADAYRFLENAQVAKSTLNRVLKNHPF